MLQFCTLLILYTSQATRMAWYGNVTRKSDHKSSILQYNMTQISSRYGKPLNLFQSLFSCTRRPEPSPYMVTIPAYCAELKYSAIFLLLARSSTSGITLSTLSATCCARGLSWFFFCSPLRTITKGRYALRPVDTRRWYSSFGWDSRLSGVSLRFIFGETMSFSCRN